MSLNDTPRGERIKIGIFGKRNAGKSSLVNALTNQNTAIVSDIKGTTTDPVSKSMELLPLGPVTVTDTPGLDDEGELGKKRVAAAYGVLDGTDIAVIAVEGTHLSAEDEELIKKIKEKNIPYVTVYNKSDLYGDVSAPAPNEISVSARTGKNTDALRELIANVYGGGREEKHIIADKLGRGDFVVLVTPMDAAAPKGRLILPQQQTIRDILDAGAVAIVSKPEELADTLKTLGKEPQIVITDSQAFGYVSKVVAQHIKLTSFSVLMARYKGTLAEAAAGAKVLDTLGNGDRVLICEGCTHRRQCGDIGTVKLPNLIRKHTGANPNFDFRSGTDFPENLSEYKLVLHCGGCMLTEKEMQSRSAKARAQGVPTTNYGTAIAHMHGILKRSLELFPEIEIK